MVLPPILIIGARARAAPQSLRLCLELVSSVAFINRKSLNRVLQGSLKQSVYGLILLLNDVSIA